MNNLLKLTLLFMALVFIGANAFPDSGKFVLVKNTNKELNNGDTVIIVNKNHSVAIGQRNDDNKRRHSASVVIDGDTAFSTKNVQMFILQNKNTNGTKFRFYVSKDSLIYQASRIDNEEKLMTGHHTSTREDSENLRAEIKVKTDEIVFGGNKSDYPNIRYNSQKDFFGCYYDASKMPDGDVAVYKKVPYTGLKLSLQGNDDKTSNSESLQEYLDKTVETITVNRSFVADGGWYTLCLPFALTETDISTTFKGAEFQQFSGVTAENNGGAYILKFDKVNSTIAGDPYLVRPKVDVENPEFLYKKIEAVNPGSVTHDNGDNGSYSFNGTLDPTSLDDKEGNFRFVGGEKGTSLIRPNGDDSKLKPLRAYFVLPETVSVAKIGIDGETTEITRIDEDVKDGNRRIYGIDGRFVGCDTKVLPKGIYLRSGEKILVK